MKTVTPAENLWRRFLDDQPELSKSLNFRIVEKFSRGDRVTPRNDDDENFGENGEVVDELVGGSSVTVRFPSGNLVYGHHGLKRPEPR